MFNIQGRKWAKRGFLVLASALLSAVSGFYTPIARAASNSLELSSVSVLSKSEGVEGDITKSGETDIEHSITFHKVGDSVDFSVKMTNKDAQKYVVESVAAENDNEFIQYEIGDYAGTIIQENGEFVFTVHEVYAKQLDDLTQRAQAASVKFTIKFDEKVEEIIVNPKTGDSISAFVGIAVVSVIGLVFAVYMIRKNKKALGIIAVLVVAALVIVPANIANADDDFAVINLTGEYKLEDRAIVKMTIEGEEQEVIVDYGSTLPEPEEPQKEGYTFKAWKDEEGNDFDFETPVTGDIVLTAEFDANKYNVIFQGNGETEGTMDSIELTYDKSAILPATGFKKQGYNFVGWNTEADGNGTWYADKADVKNLSTSADVTLFAQWEARNDTPYTVYHKKMNLDGTYTIAETENLQGTTDTSVTPGVRLYKHFKSPKTQTKNIDGDGKMEIEYLYERNKYKLTLTNEKYINSSFTSGEYYYDTLITLSVNKVLGYTFGGWTNGDMGVAVKFKLTKDTTIGPIYKPNKYTVVFDKNGATDGVMDDYYTYYDETFELPENKFKRVGYDFVGWNTKADGSGAAYKDMAKVKNLAAAGTATLYAQWKARTDTKYVVVHEKMNLDGKTYTVFSSQKYKGTSDDYVTPSVIEIKGFIMPELQRVKIEPDGSTVITYQYKRMKFDLTLTNEEFIESDFTTGSYFFETAITLTAKERKGYKFKKWSDGDTNTIISFKLTFNKTIGPEYLPNKYNVQFDKNGATSGSMDTVYTYYDEHFTLPDNQFKRQGYDFTGWNTKADGSGNHYANNAKVFNLATEGSVTLYAQWKARKDTPYTVEHWQMNLNGKGYTLFETDKLQGETDTEVEPETKKYVGFKAPKTKKITIKADGSAKVVYEYERKKYTLTIVDPANVNEGLTSSKFYYGTVITLSGKKKTGYTLTHWTNGMTGEEISFELLGDMKIGPVYEANKYAIIFDANGNNDITGEMPNQIHTYDQRLKLTKNAYKRAGYDFYGWSRTKDAIALNMKIVGDEYEVFNMSTGDDVTLYAQWQPRHDTKYTVRHMLMKVDGSGYDEDTEHTEILEGTTDTLVTAPAREYEGFISPKKQTKNIAGDGSMVIEYLYVRDTRLLALTDEKYIETEQPSGKYNYGTTITLKAKDVPGYKFVAWTNGSTEKTISFELFKDTEIGPTYKANEYTVRFDGNGATNNATMDDVTMTYDADPVKLPENKFARMGYDYAGSWNTDPKGNGSSYLEGAEVKNLTTGDVVILYAQWIARDDTAYTVVHRVEELNGSFVETSIPMTGTTDTFVEPAVNTYEHHDSPAVQKKQITGDGQMKIVYEYPLSKFQLTIVDESHVETTTHSGLYKYGTTVSLKAKKRTDDYYFTNWSNGDTAEEISLTITGATTISPEYAFDNDFHNAFYKAGPCKFNGPHAPMDGDGCEDDPDEEGYVDTHIALFSQTNLRKDFVVSFNISGLDAYASNVNNQSDDWRPTFFNSTLEQGPGYPGVVVRRHNGTSDLMIGSNVVKNGRKISDMKIPIAMSSVQSITLIRKDDNFCYSINGGAPVFVNNYANHDATFNQTAFFGASIENDVIYRNLKGTMSNMTIKLGKDVHNRFTCEQN